MNNRPRIYLDHAATSWPKSDAVTKAMVEFMQECGAAAGRGGYASAAVADRLITQTRRQIASLVSAESSDAITFHSNGTSALNAAIHGVLRAGDHVVTCAAEHNSVLRPLRYLEQHSSVQLTVVPVDADGRVDAQQMLDAIDNDTRMVALTHASNVTGAVQPVKEIASAIHDRATLFLCDAAQTFGILPVSVEGIDLLAAPGHKASGGPLGTAFLYVDPSIEDQVTPFIQGGTGSQSESMEMPTGMPSKLEPGNLNVPALAGWSAALREIVDTGMDSRQQRGKELAERMNESLSEIDGLSLYGHPDELPIASVTVEGLSPIDLAAILDAEFRIETRAGMHCAAAIHACLGSEAEGTLRISAGIESTESELDAVAEAFRSITATMKI
ncbi:MAG: aminotransferase class V-fold PLP-dependent enzyme [Planctomycetota bacterium]